MPFLILLATGSSPSKWHCHRIILAINWKIGFEWQMSLSPSPTSVGDQIEDIHSLGFKPSIIPNFENVLFLCFSAVLPSDLSPKNQPVVPYQIYRLLLTLFITYFCLSFLFLLAFPFIFIFLWNILPPSECINKLKINILISGYILSWRTLKIKSGLGIWIYFLIFVLETLFYKSILKLSYLINTHC